MERACRESKGLTVFSCCLVMVLTLLPGLVSGWERYDQGCNLCHDLSGENKPLHRAHVQENLVGAGNGNCNLCHPNGDGSKPVLTYRSDRNQLMGCNGCHGRDYGEISPIDSQPKSSAKGLRKYHDDRGEGACFSCHGVETGILGENILPEYYKRADVVQKDPCNGDNREDSAFDIDTIGLDNDGDGFGTNTVDGLDPDCAGAPCTATAAAQPLSAVICEGESVQLSDANSTADCSAGGALMYEWYSGPFDVTKTPVGTGPVYNTPVGLTPGVNEFDLLVYCDNDPTCFDTLDVLVSVDVKAKPAVDCGTTPITGTAGQWIPIGTNAQSDGQTFLWSAGSGQLQNETTLNGAQYWNDVPGMYDVTLGAAIDYGAGVVCEEFCVIQVIVEPPGGCPNPMPGEITRLMAVKEADNIHFSWDYGANSGFYRVYSVDLKTGLPARFDNGGNERCASPDDLTTDCIHQSVISSQPDKLFYEVVGVCNGDPTMEGP